MAHVIGVKALALLLADAEKANIRFAWIDNNRLVLGAELGLPDMFADLGAEKLLPFKRKTRAPASNAGIGDRKVEPSGPGSKSSMPAASDLPTFSGRQTGIYCLTIEDVTYTAKSQKELLLIGFSAIERVAPGTMAKLERDRSRTKRVVSKSREALNDDVRIAEKYSQQIEGDWWISTNNSYPETLKYLQRAGFYAGLNVEVTKMG